MTIVEGNTAPQFSLPDDQNHILTMDDFKGKKLILYFYPKDDTPGCTTQACDVRDNFQQLSKLNVAVVGVSKDSVASHQKFKAKYDLNFPLLSDEQGQLCEAYGVWKEKKNYGKTYMGIERSTFLIDENGVVKKVWRGVKASGHIDELLTALQEV